MTSLKWLLVTSESSSSKDCDFGVSASSCQVQQVLIKESYSTTFVCLLLPGTQPRLKSWGGPRFGSQHPGTCAPRPVKGRAGCWVRGRGRPLPLKVGGPVSPGPYGCCAYDCCYGDTLKTHIFYSGVKLGEISPNPRMRHIQTDIPLTCWDLDSGSVDLVFKDRHRKCRTRE